MATASISFGLTANAEVRIEYDDVTLIVSALIVDATNGASQVNYEVKNNVGVVVTSGTVNSGQSFSQAIVGITLSKILNAKLPTGWTLGVWT